MDAENGRAEIRVTSEEARRIAALLRYAVSLNTTAGLVSPTERRLVIPTYHAVEIAEYLEITQQQLLELVRPHPPESARGNG